MAKGKKSELFSYGLGSWVLGDEAILKNTTAGKEKEKQDPNAANDQVDLVIDGVGSGYFWSGAYGRLYRAGVPVARFLHSYLPWRTPFLNLRNHRKLLVVDGRIGFTGGLNIGAENLLADNPPHPVRDTHFRFEGPVVAQLTEAFADDWLFETSERLSQRLKQAGIDVQHREAIGSQIGRA